MNICNVKVVGEFSNGDTYFRGRCHKTRTESDFRSLEVSCRYLMLLFYDYLLGHQMAQEVTFLLLSLKNFVPDDGLFC